MARNTRNRGLGRAFSIIGDVIATTAAVRAHRQPEARALRRLGIDPEQFARIGRY